MKNNLLIILIFYTILRSLILSQFDAFLDLECDCCFFVCPTCGRVMSNNNLKVKIVDDGIMCDECALFIINQKMEKFLEKTENKGE